MTMLTGTEVSTHYRWPCSAFHPDCWEPPHKGVVLANNDPRAWANTLAFPGRTPTQEEVDAHLANLAERNIPLSNTPVLYQFGVMWDTEVRPYEEVLAEWQAARQKKYEDTHERVATVL